MAPKIALQLYTLRDLTKNDYAGIIRQVAAMGYSGVETAGFAGTTVEAAAKLFKELGLTVVGAHSPFPIGAQKNEILDASCALDAKYMVCAHIGPDDTKDMDAVKNLCDRINESAANSKERGLAFAIHNHWWEYLPLEGKLAVDWIIEMVDPAVLFELDTYWIQVAGLDPAERVRLMGKRSPFLHIKDGPCTREAAQTAVGTGKMDIPAILKAGGSNTEWWIMEADSVDGDPIEAVRQSQVYMANLVK